MIFFQGEFLLILVENHFSNSDINRVISTLEQIKTRLSLVERWNVSYIYERLQKLQGDLHQIHKRPSADEVRSSALFFFLKFYSIKNSFQTSMISDSVDVASKLDKIEQKSTEFSQVAKELDVRQNELSFFNYRICLYK